MIPPAASTAIPRTVSWGILLALGTALISGVSVYVNAFAVKQLPDPAVYTTLKNGVAAALLIALAVATIRPVAIRGVSRRSWGWLAAIGIVGGSVPFLLFFTGLAQASAPTAAFIHKTLFVWVAFLAVPLLGERLGLAQIAALGVLLGGQLLIVPPIGISWGAGETMIAAATLLWAVESVIAKRVLRTVPAGVVAVARLGVGLVVLIGYLAATGRLGAVAALTSDQWRWVLITGALLSGYVATWFAALQRAPASLVTAMLVVGAPITAALQALQTGGLPAAPALLGQLLILAAAGGLAFSGVRRWRIAPAAAWTGGRQVRIATPPPDSTIGRIATGLLATDWNRPISPAPGPIRFARYAFGPNKLGYCGPDEAEEMFQQATSGHDLRRLRELAGQFEGAYPYLRLIANSNGRADPLDAAVVEAYWLGGRLLDRIPAADFGRSLEDRFRRRLAGSAWRWLGGKPEAGAVPNHAFHVLDVFPRVGLLKSSEIDRVLETMDACRIRWGRVLERAGDALVVSAVPLEMANGRLRLGRPRVERIRGWVDGAGFVEDAAPGDVVSIHWDWACERLDGERLDALQRATAGELRIANQTI